MPQHKAKSSWAGASAMFSGDPQVWRFELIFGETQYAHAAEAIRRSRVSGFGLDHHVISTSSSRSSSPISISSLKSTSSGT